MPSVLPLDVSPALGDALAWYQGLGYRHVNRRLRDRPALGPYRTRVQNTIGELDRALQTATALPTGATLYRGVRGWQSRWLDRDSFIDPGYCSTSRSRGGLLRLRLAEPIAGIELADYGGDPGENEILLPRGLRCVVTDRGLEWSEWGAITVVQARLERVA
jgi:ADP-ribosyltransferase exoenzyme